jgi:tetratricopeptide (TPR) repeat protein
MKGGGTAAGRPRWRAALAVAVAGLALAPLPALVRGAGGGRAPTEVEAALRAGNRLYREGRLAEAMTAYAAGWPPHRSAVAGAAVLAYNLGTTAHRRGRLAEAVLWYRRAAAARLDDPWLDDNLALARAQAGGRALPPTGLLAHLAAAAPLPEAATVVLAWMALALFALALSGRHSARRAWPAVAGLALLAWAAVALAARGPRPAVLLAPCAGAGGGLPAASEVWVGRSSDGRRPVLGGPAGLSCPEPAVGLVGGAS